MENAATTVAPHAARVFGFEQPSVTASVPVVYLTGNRAPGDGGTVDGRVFDRLPDSTRVYHVVTAAGRRTDVGATTQIVENAGHELRQIGATPISAAVNEALTSLEQDSSVTGVTLLIVSAQLLHALVVTRDDRTRSVWLIDAKPSFPLPSNREYGADLFAAVLAHERAVIGLT